MTENKRIDSFQALRAISFIGIFLSHVGVMRNWSGLGVSVFFVLSAFLLTNKYKNEEVSCGMKDSFLFMKKRIGRLYLLHIITMAFALLRTVAQAYSDHVPGIEYGKLLGYTALNVTLLQSFVPSAFVCVTLNGVAWYLSTLVALYFLFPIILKGLKKIQAKWTLVLVSAGVLVAQVILSYICRNVQGFDGSFFIWLTYHSFIFRIGDLIVGICLALIFASGKETDSKITVGYNFFEIAATALSVAFYYFFAKGTNNEWINAMLNRTTGFIILAAVWVYLFAKRKGILTFLLTNRVTVWLGNLSPYAFLIHFVTAQYVYSVMTVLHIADVGAMRIARIAVQFALSIVLSMIYVRFKEKKVAK